MCRYLLPALAILQMFGTQAAFHRAISSRTEDGGLPYSYFSSTRTAPTTTAVHASSIKFRNFEDMLDAFRMEPILVYFSATNCGTCYLQKKELSALRSKMGDSAPKVLSIDTEKWPHVGTRFQIRALPCLLVVKDKQVLLRLDGLTRAEDLATLLHTVPTHS